MTESLVVCDTVCVCVVRVFFAIFLQMFLPAGAALAQARPQCRGLSVYESFVWLFFFGLAAFFSLSWTEPVVGTASESVLVISIKISN